MTKEKFIIGGIIAIIGIIIFILILRKDDIKYKKYNEMINKEYPTLQIKDSIDSEITDIYKYKGSLLAFNEVYFEKHVTCTGNRKITILSKKCLSNNKTELANVLYIGSHIKKTTGSDTLIIINNKKKYKFVIIEIY